MNNRILSYKTLMFHQQNVPVKSELEWTKFLCCLEEGGYFETVRMQEGLASIQASLLAVFVKAEVLYILAGTGIYYVDPETGIIKPTNKTDQTFTWAGETAGGRMWFSGQDLGLWYAEARDPYTIIQSNITAGTFSGITNRAGNWSVDSREVIIGTGGAYTIRQSDNAMNTTSQLNHGWKYGMVQLVSGSDEPGYEGLWSAYFSSPQAKVSSGVFKQYVTCSDSSRIYFREGGDIYRAAAVTHDAAAVKLDSGDGIFAKYGMTAQNNKTYLCTTAGIKVYNPSLTVIQNTNISTGEFYCCGIAPDGIMYFCGEDGVFYLDNDTGEILPIPETDKYIQCLLLDKRLYFTDGQDVKTYKSDSNTGASVAEDLNLIKTKFGEKNIMGTYSILDTVQPIITPMSLRKLSRPQILQRAADVIDAVVSEQTGNPKPANEAYNPDSADMCPIGGYGVASKIIWGQFVGTGDNVSNGRINKYEFAQSYYFGYNNYTNGFLAIYALYIDNIEFFKTEKIELVVNTNNVNKGALMVGLIEYPPEEWNTTYGNSESFYAIMQKMNENTRRKGFARWSDNNDHRLDISGIYNGPNAKTLAAYGYYGGSSSGNSRINSKYINGENWQFSLYKVCIVDWSDGVTHTSTGKSIAKTLTMTVAILGRQSVFSILDAFGTEPAITEADYVALSTEAIEQRATALMKYAAAQEGQTRYKENNSVIS